MGLAAWAVVADSVAKVADAVVQAADAAVETAMADWVVMAADRVAVAGWVEGMAWLGASLSRWCPVGSPKFRRMDSTAQRRHSGARPRHPTRLSCQLVLLRSMHCNEQHDRLLNTDLGTCGHTAE